LYPFCFFSLVPSPALSYIHVCSPFAGSSPGDGFVVLMGRASI
jgi:hypothetical protein